MLEKNEMKKENKIPTIEPSKGDEFHFRTVEWPVRLTEQHDLFHINRLEDYRDKMDFPLPPHRKTVHDLIFITKGNSTRSKGLNKHVFKKNQIFFLPRLQITAHEQMSDDVEGFFLHFSPDLITDINQSLKKFSFLNFLNHPIVSISAEEVPFILNIFYRLEKLYLNLKKEDLDLVAQYLFTLLKEVNRYVIKEDAPTSKNTAVILTERYKNALTQHIYEIQTVQKYAELLFVTPNHLNKCVKNTLNKTAQALLNEMLILEGKSLLKYSGMSISGIAEKLGNRTPTNFSRFFKSQTGMTPKEYSKT